MSPFNPPSDIAQGPADRGSCIAQCLSMGHDSVSRHDAWVGTHADKATKLGMQKASEMQKTQMFYTCAKGAFIKKIKKIEKKLKKLKNVVKCEGAAREWSTVVIVIVIFIS